jgi:RpiB/LacA/LacB family sugar-phosphate isomerase
VKLAIGSDHAGFKLKWQVANWLRTPAGGRHQILDVGTASEESCDYPDFAKEVAKAVVEKRVSKGILFCGTGIGMAMAANKVPGALAAVTWNTATAALAAEHNGANILCIPARYSGLKKTELMIKTFLTTRFGGGRHARRVKKILALDKCTSG